MPGGDRPPCRAGILPASRGWGPKEAAWKAALHVSHDEAREKKDIGIDRRNRSAASAVWAPAAIGFTSSSETEIAERKPFISSLAIRSNAIIVRSDHGSTSSRW